MKNEYTTSEISLFGKTGKVTFQFLRLVESHYENLPFITDVMRACLKICFVYTLTVKVNFTRPAVKCDMLFTVDQ